MSQVVVLTGVSRGIGRACALRLAKRGVQLALVGRASQGHQATCADCEQLGAVVLSVACELSDPVAIARAAEAILQRFGAPDVLINNAGVLARGPRVEQIELADWQRVLRVNLTAPFLLCKALLPAMLAAGRGRFIHIASVSSTIASPLAAAYGASKWGLLGFNKSLAAELSGSGLMSMCILPGGVDTDMLKQTPFSPDVTLADIAEVVCYHALDAPVALNGTNVEVFG